MSIVSCFDPDSPCFRLGCFGVQARHGKKKRLEETLNAGFEINAEDAMGNTLLLAAVQQLQVSVLCLKTLELRSTCEKCMLYRVCRNRLHTPML